MSLVRIETENAIRFVVKLALKTKNITEKRSPIYNQIFRFKEGLPTYSETQVFA